MKTVKRIARWAAAALVIFGSPWAATGRAALEQEPIPTSTSVKLGLSLVGIGAVLNTLDGRARVTELVPGGPADRDGRLKAGDIISAVAQGDAAFVDCAGLPLDKVVDMIRGKKGAIVRLKVIPAGAADPKQTKVIAIVRDVVKVNSALDAQLSETEKKIAEAQRKLLVEEMDREVADVVQATGLDEGGRKALEAAAAKAIGQSMDKSKDSVDDLLQAELKETPVNAVQMLSQWTSNMETVASWAQSRGGNWPDDQPAWTDALKQTLSPAQAAAWAGAEAKRKEAVEAEIADYLKTVARISSDQPRREIDEKIGQIQMVLALPKDRQDKLDAFEKSLLARYGDAARARAEKALLAMSDDARKREISGRNYYAWVEPVNDTDWDDSLAKLLTPDEMKRMQTAEEDRRGRRARAMGNIMVSLLDEKIAFTDAQRRQLEPICQTLVRSQPELLADQPENSYGFYSRSRFYAAASTGPGDRITAILDPIQWKHWQELSLLDDVPEGYEQQFQQLPQPEDPDKPQPAAEPEDVENAISNFLEEKSRAQRETLLAANILKAEDVARVDHLPAGVAERLQTAARGAAEDALDAWKASTEKMLRSNLGDVSPDTVKERLAGIQSFQFQQNIPRRPDEESIWNSTVKSLLGPDQQKAWQKEIDERNAYRTKAINGMIVSAFDQRVGISAEQWAKLEPLVGKVTEEYGNEIGRWYLGFGESPWFLQSFTMFLPLAGIPEKEMKALLTKDQWDRWSGSMIFANATTNWQNIERMHQQNQQRVNDVRF